MADLGRLFDRRSASVSLSLQAPNPQPERGPSPEVRPPDSGERARSLTISTGLSGKDATGAWVTVTDAQGTVYFEGQPADDGTVAIFLADEHGVDRLRVLLETVRSHRQAEVSLGDGATEYAFD